MKKIMVTLGIAALALSACSEEVNEEGKNSTKDNPIEQKAETPAEENVVDNQEEKATASGEIEGPIVKNLETSNELSKEKYKKEATKSEEVAKVFIDSEKVKISKNPITQNTIFTLDTSKLTDKEKGVNYFIEHNEKIYYLMPNKFNEELVLVEFSPNEISDEEVDKLKVIVQ